MNPFSFGGHPEVFIVEGSNAETVVELLRTHMAAGSKLAGRLHDMILSWMRGALCDFSREFFLNSTRDLATSIVKYFDIRCSFYYTKSMTSSNMFLYDIVFVDLEYWISTGKLGIPAQKHPGIDGNPSVGRDQNGGSADSCLDNSQRYHTLLSILLSDERFQFDETPHLGRSINVGSLWFDFGPTFDADISPLEVGANAARLARAFADGNVVPHPGAVSFLPSAETVAGSDDAGGYPVIDQTSTLLAGGGLSDIHSRGDGCDTITLSSGDTVSVGTGAYTVIAGASSIVVQAGAIDCAPHAGPSGNEYCIINISTDNIVGWLTHSSVLEFDGDACRAAELAIEFTTLGSNVAAEFGSDIVQWAASPMRATALLYGGRPRAGRVRVGSEGYVASVSNDSRAFTDGTVRGVVNRANTRNGETCCQRAIATVTLASPIAERTNPRGDLESGYNGFDANETVLAPPPRLTFWSDEEDPQCEDTTATIGRGVEVKALELIGA